MWGFYNPFSISSSSVVRLGKSIQFMVEANNHKYYFSNLRTTEENQIEESNCCLNPSIKIGLPG